MGHIGHGRCDEPGPYGAHCTEDICHRWSHYDATEDVSWQDDWRENTATHRASPHQPCDQCQEAP